MRVGPTVPRWRLGEELGELRQQAGVSLARVADTLGCSEWKIKKIEQGAVGVAKTEFAAMLDLYGVGNAELRSHLAELQRLGKQRGWWSKYSRPLAKSVGLVFFGLESAAATIRTWEPTYVPGLLQTQDYYLAMAEGELVDRERAEVVAETRRARQALVWDEEPRALWFIIDEAVLRRSIGGAEIMRAQLTHMVGMSDRCTLQVLPVACGAHPGMPGGLTLFEFDEDLHTPVVFLEGHAGQIYLEDEYVARGKIMFEHLTAAALSPSESRHAIEAAADRL